MVGTLFGANSYFLQNVCRWCMEFQTMMVWENEYQPSYLPGVRMLMRPPSHPGLSRSNSPIFPRYFGTHCASIMTLWMNRYVGFPVRVPQWDTDQ
ncbi:hypothetical protein B0I35DRAFT_437663 [Stachybotrys elegans]|uniref:Uncharacterized protein n=1 Tax=Stachybotrys elegans TaxID=80388 RepID=A0A8K0SN31_9HYPO|nr:hypothetical protein B0I35DRAFT_437663 [Stachybotrys elegans]